MTTKNAIFGEIEFKTGWSRVIIVNFFEHATEVDLIIDGEEDGQFDEGQYRAYQSLLNNWNDVQQQILKSVLTYYQQKRNELGFDIEVNNNYPLVETTNEILKMISIDGIVVPYADIYDGRDIGITFNCSWDTENGLGIRLLNEKVTKVGYQDIAI
ncbi:DUF6985 domain-containing protein [Jeotgalibacillus campisalis]|uniref:Cytoplasmic protein n=1 Tax=Jeotgalibacillus campisalis TaxID=220754 RepID=A0A0C2VGJ0_9BACL|nr:DUF2004 domain-containing protein [Jeotgalibacillus campisalis]KIL43108.1 cytoplasmic protein [Jeotgalibacillus campisalis]